MEKAYCLLNHRLTENQVAELEKEYKVEKIVYPEEALSKNWSQIKPCKKLDRKVIDDVVNSLKKNDVCAGDVFVIQGEFGSTFMLIDYALKTGLVPVHAVTERVETEQVNGETVTRQYVFRHVCFRKYEYFSEISK